MACHAQSNVPGSRDTWPEAGEDARPTGLPSLTPPCVDLILSTFMAFQKLLQHHGAVVGFVVGGKDQGDSALLAFLF